ncbi:CHAP domain-containing protein [Hamadaea sp. NPDC051192]|uniref:CHAP domain-containing protein n=1 Tax=Hamadaea sp. NPDC051192 TaxID=3154940 RepID=UPI00341CD648
MTTVRRAARAALLTVLATAAALVAAAPAAHAAETVSARATVATDGTPLNIRTGPGTGTAVVGQLPDDAAITVYCVVQGQAVTGPWGTTTWWDKIDPAADRYVTDALVYTGTMEPVAALCGSGHQDKPSSQITDPATYPYANGNPAQADGMGYYQRECVSFAAWAVTHDAIADNNTDPSWLGNAWMWGYDPRATRRTGTPQPGDIAWWDRNTISELGHVAYVAQVTDTAVLIYEYNGSGDHQLRTNHWIGLNEPSAYLKL